MAKKPVDPLKSLSDEELDAELSRRRNEKRTRRAAERQKANVLVVRHIDALLSIAAGHGKTSCTDAGKQNATHGCDRCALLSFKDQGFMDDEFKLLISVVKSPIE